MSLFPPFLQDKALNDLPEKLRPFSFLFSLSSPATPCPYKRPELGYGSTALGVGMYILFSLLFLFLVCLWVGILQFQNSGGN